MANVLVGNSIYVDTGSTDVATGAQFLVSYITLTTTAANGHIILTDTNSPTFSVKIDLKLAADGSSQLFDFSRRPLVFPNGIHVTTLANAVATLVGTKNGA